MNLEPVHTYSYTAFQEVLMWVFSSDRRGSGMGVQGGAGRGYVCVNSSPPFISPTFPVFFLLPLHDSYSSSLPPSFLLIPPPSFLPVYHLSPFLLHDSLYLLRPFVILPRTPPSPPFFHFPPTSYLPPPSFSSHFLPPSFLPPPPPSLVSSHAGLASFHRQV